MRSQHGRSLAETLVTLAIMAILSLVGLPGLSATLDDARRTSTINELVLTVQLARSESAKRAVPVTLCASRDGQRCAAGTDWSAGWVLFVNHDDDAPAQVDEGEPVLRHWTLAGAPRVESNRSAFTLRPFGARATNGTLRVCSGDREARAVVVGPTGRPRIAARDARGHPFPC